MEQCAQDLKEKYTFDELANKCLSYMRMFEAEQVISLSKRAEIEEKNRKIKEMQSHIDCLKAELKKVQRNKPELPIEPIEVVAMIVKKTVVDKNGFGQEKKYKAYNETDLRQIAEHLLVYCNHAEVE